MLLYADMHRTKQHLAERTELPHVHRHSRAKQKVLDVGAICQRRAHHSDRAGSNRTRDRLRTIVSAEISDNPHPREYSAFQRSLPPVQVLPARISRKTERGRVEVGVAEKDVTAGRNLRISCDRENQARGGYYCHSAP